MCVGGPAFNIFRFFKINRQQRVLVYEKFSQFKSVVSGVPQCSVLGHRYCSSYILLICGMILKIKLFLMQRTPLSLLKVHVPLII